MASEIIGLAELRGFLKLGNLVVRLHLPFIELPHRHPASCVERPLPASVSRRCRRCPHRADRPPRVTPPDIPRS